MRERWDVKSRCCCIFDKKGGKTFRMLLAAWILWYAGWSKSTEPAVSLEMCPGRNTAFYFKSTQSLWGEKYAADNLLVLQISAST